MIDLDNYPNMIPLIREKFDEIEGACDYFSLLDQENDRIEEELEA